MNGIYGQIELPFQGAINWSAMFIPNALHWAEISWTFSPEEDKPKL